MPNVLNAGNGVKQLIWTRVVHTINQFAKFLARFEKGNSLRWHFDSGSGSWIASDACSSLARVEASESADLDLVPGSQSTDDAVKYGAHDDVGFLQGHPNGLVNLFGQIGSGHLVRPRRITKKSITALPGAPDSAKSRVVGHSESGAGTAICAKEIGFVDGVIR